MPDSQYINKTYLLILPVGGIKEHYIQAERIDNEEVPQCWVEFNALWAPHTALRATNALNSVAEHFVVAWSYTQSRVIDPPRVFDANA